MGKNKKNKNSNSNAFFIDDDDNNNNINNDNNNDNVNVNDNDWTPHKNKKKINTFALLVDEEPTQVPTQVIVETNTKLEPKQVIVETNSKQVTTIDNLTMQEAFNIGNSYDLSGNYLEAIKFYKFADNLGSKNASGNLAILLDENNLEGADFYYKKAIRNGNIGSLYDYAEYLCDKLQDHTLALKYFTYYKMMKNSDSDDKILWKKIIKNIL